MTFLLFSQYVQNKISVGVACSNQKSIRFFYFLAKQRGLQLYICLFVSLPCDKQDSLAGSWVISKTPHCFSQCPECWQRKSFWIHYLKPLFFFGHLFFLPQLPLLKGTFLLYLTILKDKYHEIGQKNFMTIFQIIVE